LLLISDINHQPIDNKGVEINISRHKNTIILPWPSCHDHHPENIIARMKNILAASLGVDQPRWSFLGANKYSAALIESAVHCCHKNPCLTIDGDELFK